MHDSNNFIQDELFVPRPQHGGSPRGYHPQWPPSRSSVISLLEKKQHRDVVAHPCLAPPDDIDLRSDINCFSLICHFQWHYSFFDPLHQMNYPTLLMIIHLKILSLTTILSGYISTKFFFSLWKYFASRFLIFPSRPSTCFMTRTSFRTMALKGFPSRKSAHLHIISPGERKRNPQPKDNNCTIPYLQTCFVSPLFILTHSKAVYQVPHYPSNNILSLTYEVLSSQVFCPLLASMYGFLALVVSPPFFPQVTR